MSEDFYLGIIIGVIISAFIFGIYRLSGYLEREIPSLTHGYIWELPKKDFDAKLAKIKGL